MATKKKTEESVSLDPNEIVSRLIIKKWGEVLVDADHIIENKKNKVIPISPSLNIGLGGGILSGTSTIIAGREKSGKTTTAGSIAAQAQKQGRKVYWLSIEARYRERDLKGIKDLDFDPKKLQIVKSEEGAILDGDDFLEIALEIIRNHPRCLVIIDSMSALVSGSELTEDIEKQKMGGNAKTVKKFTKLASNILPCNDVTLIYIHHVYSNLGVPGVTIGGGSGPKYFSDGIITIRKSQPLVAGQYEVGKVITWSIDNTPLGSKKIVSAPEGILRYNVGLCRETEILNMACDIGLIDKTEKGAWFKMPDGKKLQGTQSAYEFLLENTSLTNSLEKQVYEYYAPEILKYYEEKSEEEIEEEYAEPTETPA